MKKKLILTLTLFLSFKGSTQRFISKVSDDSLSIEINKLDERINSEFDDYAPVFTIDGSEIYFTSKRPINGSKKSRKNIHEKVYLSKYDFNTKQWKQAIPMNDTINFSKVSNSAIGISNDGQILLLFGSTNEETGDVFISQLEGKQWTFPKSIESPINSEYHETSACFSPDGKTIYFVSDRENGQGKRDIWFSLLDENGNWGQPVNIGENINSKFDEEAVFMHPNGNTLYFSSKGHGSIGGYDVFYSVFEDENWSKPKPAPGKINTIGDDLFFTLKADESLGYYSTNNTSKRKDIYEIKFSALESTPIKSNVIVVKGEVSDFETNNPLEASISIYDSLTKQTIREIKSNSASGKFMISLPTNQSYSLIVKEKNHQDYTDYLVINDFDQREELVLNIKLKGQNITQEPLRVNYKKTDITKYGGNDGKIDLTIDGGLKPYSFNWSNGSKEQNIHNLQKGTYVCNVSDKSGNYVNISVELTEPNLIIQKVQSIDTSNLSFTHYFDYNESNLTIHDSELKAFLFNIENQFKNGRDSITLFIYSSSSNVPSLKYKNNQNLANKRAQNLELELLSYFNRKKFKSRVLVKVMSSVVSGPTYNSDNIEKEKYKPFQYVQIKSR